MTKIFFYRFAKTFKKNNQICTEKSDFTKCTVKFLYLNFHLNYANFLNIQITLIVNQSKSQIEQSVRR